MNGTDPLGLTDELDLGIPGVGRFASTVTGRTGGAVPAGDPLRLEYERMGRAYPTAPAGGPLESLHSLFGGPKTQPEIMHQLLKMRPLMQEERAQQQAEQKQRHEEEKQRLDVAKYLFGELDKYRQAPPEQQAILAPAIERMWTFAAPRIGLSMSPEDVRNMLPRPDLDKIIKGMIGVDPLTRDQQAEAQSAFGVAAPSDQRLKVAEALTKKWTAQAESDLRHLLPAFMAGNGTPGSGYRERLERQGLLKPGAPISYELFLRGMRDITNSDQPGLKELAGNRFYRDAFTTLMKDEKFLTGLGVQSPKGTYAAQTAGGVRAAQLAAEREPEAVRGAAEKAQAVAAGTARGQLQPDIIAGETEKTRLAEAVRLKEQMRPEVIAAQVKKRVDEQMALLPGELKKLEATEATKAKYARPQQGVELAGKIRDDYGRYTKDFLTVRDAYSQIEAVATGEPSAAGDLTLIFSFMKLLDPTSVVREGEQATAASARGVPDAIRNMYNRVMSGERLVPEQRQDFLARSGQVFKARLTSHLGVEREFKEIAVRGGANPQDAVPDLIGRYRRLVSPDKTAEERARARFPDLGKKN